MLQAVNRLPLRSSCNAAAAGRRPSPAAPLRTGLHQTQPAPLSSRAMGQKSLDSFFKRPASSQGAAKDAAAPATAGGGDAVQPAAAEAVAGVPPQPPAAAAAAAGDGSAADAAEDVHAAQASEQQRMRAAANRNAALAKQVGAAGARGVLNHLPSAMRRLHGIACRHLPAHSLSHSSTTNRPSTALDTCRW